MESAFCIKARKELLMALAKKKDARALPMLERELSRPKRETHCYDRRVYTALRKLRRIAVEAH